MDLCGVTVAVLDLCGVTVAIFGVRELAAPLVMLISQDASCISSKVCSKCMYAELELLQWVCMHAHAGSQPEKQSLGCKQRELGMLQ